MSGPAFALAPFALLLLTIAFAPVIARHHWERQYHRVCALFIAVSCGYYAFVLRDLHTVVSAAADYFSFIVVVGAFFIVAGGIHLSVRARGSALRNALFLLAGALLANAIGTIGASLLLVRPWLQMNRGRNHAFHTAFFIFVVSNIGGALLPVGPPLFLGYLKGIPFWWPATRCLAPWLVTMALVLTAFVVIDHWFTRRARPIDLETFELHWRFDGRHNLALIALLIAAMIFLPFGWREVVMAGAAVVGLIWTPRAIFRLNAFTFAPLREVAWLFAAIFATMMPVLSFVEAHAAAFPVRTRAEFFWSTGLLSAALDNAPTYLTFLALAFGLENLNVNNPAHVAEFIARHDARLIAISLGATFFGALTYIGNGPNLLVRAITEHAGAATPGFLSYIYRYALPVLLPIFVIVTLLFFW